MVFVMKTVLLQFLLAKIVIGDVLYDYLESNILFTEDYYKTFRSRHADHFMFSPASIQAVLGMVALGGEGETQKQLSELAHFHFNASKIAEMYLKLGEKLSATQTSLISHFGISIERASLNSPYRTSVENVFKANVSAYPFSMMFPSPFTETNFLLSNGITFTHHFILPEKWHTTFYDGRHFRYYISNTNSVIINSLQVRQKLNYHNNEVLKAEFLEIPITENELAVTIVLPYKTKGLSIVERNIPEILRSQSYQEMTVSVTVPRFLEHNNEYLTDYFTSDGMSIPFSDEADFTKATKSLTKISRVIHSTFFHLSKELSDNIYVVPSLISDEINFTVDRPFLYYIKHSTLGVIAIGRFVIQEYL